MRLKVIATGSSGNCYVLYNDHTALIIEAGVNISHIKEAIGYNPSKVVGALVSHEHLDHAKSVNQLMAYGIDVFASQGTFDALGVASHRAMVMKPKQQQEIGLFKILPFPVEHDCKEPFGFLIHHPECGNVLFATDTGYLRYTFPGLNNIIVEANYEQSILEENVREGRLHPVVKKRVFGAHMELGVLVDTLAANDLKAVNNILLIHLSSGNSDGPRFRKVIQEATGKSVYVAEAGMDIPFNCTPY